MGLGRESLLSSRLLLQLKPDLEAKSRARAWWWMRKGRIVGAFISSTDFAAADQTQPLSLSISDSVAH